MRPEVEADRQALDRERFFVSEVFHNLSQPLTALQCSLELSLLRDRTAEELRQSIEAALENAESLRQRLLLVRGLNDAGDPGDTSQPVDLSEMLGEVRQEMLPLFESAGQKFQLEARGGSMQVRGNRTRLMRALFYFLEYLFRYSSNGAVLRITAYEQDQEAVLDIAASSSLPVSPETDADAGPVYACEVEFARRSLRAYGGNLAPLSIASDRSVWRATLPQF